MKKHFLCILAAAAGIIVLTVQANSGDTAEGMVFSSGKAAVDAVDRDCVQIQVLHSRVCPDVRRHAEGCYVQEAVGRVVFAGEKVKHLRVGDCVGFRNSFIPCGDCANCRAGRKMDCRNAGGVCGENCRNHTAGQCRTVIVTAEGNVMKVSGTEKSEQVYSRLCGTAGHCIRLRCYEPADNDISSRGHHGHGCRRDRHCR